MGRKKHKLVEFQDKIYFSTGKLVVSDGTVEGTQEVVGPDGSSFVFSQSLTIVNDRL